jgi:hypothetical protein
VISDRTPWDQLVSAATVGVDTRAVDPAVFVPALGAVASRFGAEPSPGQVLDLAALLTAARRAGFLPQPAAALPPPAADDARPALSDEAARVLGLLVERIDDGLLADALETIAAGAFRVPELLLPGLLDLATRRTSLRTGAEKVLGERGRWLAGQNEGWRWAITIGDSADLSAMSVWHTGSPATRRAWFAAARRDDPETARQLLAQGWASEASDDRAALVALLQPQLSMSDEPFLEATLDDRRSDVRSAARILLGQLPESRWAQRMTARARHVVRLEQRPLGRRLVVELPSACDDAMIRDGVRLAPPALSGIGERVYWFEQIVGAAPLASWGLPLADLVTLDVADAADTSYTNEFRRGIRTAAIRQHDAGLARLLLGHEPPADADLAAAADLLGLLPLAEQADLLTRWLAAGDISLVALIPGLRVWPPTLADAVLRRLRGLSIAGQQAAVTVLPLVGRRLAAGREAGTTDFGAALHELAAASPSDSPWHRAVTAAAEIVMLRRRLLEELR